MQVLRSVKRKWLVPVSAVLPAGLVTGLFLSVRQPAYGQVGAGQIPNLLGRWQGEIAGYIFHDVLDPTDVPEYVQKSTYEEVLHIHFQNGRAFAGHSPDGGKVTGVLLPDGTVSMQVFVEGELRILETCTLAKHQGNFVMTGAAHMLDDLKGGDERPEMATFLVRYVKQD